LQAVDKDQVRKKTANEQARLSGELRSLAPAQWGVLLASSIREEPCPLRILRAEASEEDY